jgi:tetratricopeptide (TPR) repeat protein
MERLLLLGPPRWCGADGDRPLPPERPYQLLAFLAHHGDWVGRDRVAALFWPDHAPEAARRNVRKLLFRLREASGLPAVEERGPLLRWAVPTDLQTFEAALAAGDAAAALKAWRGDPWAGLGAEAVSQLGEWLAFERDRLRRRFLALPGALEDPARRAQALACGLVDDEAQARAPVPAPRPAADDPGFVGRRAELQQLDALLLAPEPRWITLHGPGGIGKSRLLRAALQHRPEARVIAFDDLVHPAAAWARLAEALGLRPDPALPLSGQVARQLGGAPRLLGLDNLEQIPGFALGLAPVLAACPGLRVLAGSRARLGLPGEWLFPLQGLPWPGPEDIDRAADFDAVRLFVQRARVHEPRVDPAADPAALVRLCAAVEGLPLALELAAGWTRHFSIAALAAELGQAATELLQPADAAEGGGLRACFDRSWQRLDAPAQAALAALSVFQGGCTRAAARDVAGARLPLLAALHDQSLLRRDETEAERWSLHPLLRELARERLHEDPARRAQVLEAHAAHFLRSLAHVPPAARYAERYAAVIALLPDADNLEAAWRHAVHGGRADLLAPALRALGSVLFLLGRWTALLELVQQARPLLAHDATARAVIDARCAVAHFSLGHFEAAVASGRAAMTQMRRLHDNALHRETLSYLGWSLRQLAQFDGARHCFAHGLALARADGDTVYAAVFLAGLAEIDQHFGRHAQALARAREAVALRGAVAAEAALNFGNLGATLLAAGELDEAARTLRQALQACGPHTSPLVQPHVLLCQAELAQRQGRLAEALALAEAAEAALPSQGAPALAGDLALLRCTLALAAGDAGGARRALQTVTDDALQRRDAGLQARAAAAWGEWLDAAGREDEAARTLATAIAQPHLAHDRREAARQRLAGRTAAPEPALEDLLQRLQG